MVKKGKKYSFLSGQEIIHQIKEDKEQDQRPHKEDEGRQDYEDQERQHGHDDQHGLHVSLNQGPDGLPFFFFCFGFLLPLHIVLVIDPVGLLRIVSFMGLYGDAIE